MEAYLGEDLESATSFKGGVKRSDKAFPLTSIGISQEIGGRLGRPIPHLQVDVHHPNIRCMWRSGTWRPMSMEPAGQEPGLPTGVGAGQRCSCPRH